MTDPMLSAKRFNHRGFWAGAFIFAISAIVAVALASMSARVAERPVVAETQQSIH